MLYIFAGFPKSGLDAGGLQHALEHVEELALLEHRDSVQLTKENARRVWISPSLLASGITWDWFPNEHWFGNGVTIHGTETLVPKSPATRRAWFRSEGWRAYEQRWLPGTCPRKSHIVHLTWFVTREDQRLPPAVEQRIWELIEGDGQPEPRDAYEEKHFSPRFIYQPGSPAFG